MSKKNTNCCNCATMKLEEPFFLAVCDIIEKRGYISSGLEEISNYRIFSQKFVDTPEKALLFIFDDENRRWKDDPAEIMKDVSYNEETDEYIRKTILTRDYHIPNQKQMEKILNGQYEYILIEEYVQVFNTKLISDKSLISRSINKWRERLNKK